MHMYMLMYMYVGSSQLLGTICERQGLVETSLVCCSCMIILHSRFSPQSESDKSFALKIVALLPLLFRVSPLLPLHSALVAELGDAFEAPATNGIG